MKVPEDALLLRIYLGESDRWQHQPLYEAVVLKARELHLAGATVLRADGFRRFQPDAISHGASGDGSFGGARDDTFLAPRRTSGAPFIVKGDLYSACRRRCFRPLYGSIEAVPGRLRRESATAGSMLCKCRSRCGNGIAIFASAKASVIATETSLLICSH